MYSADQNPFRTECILKIRYQLAPQELNDLLATWARHHYRGALIGPHGHGKTTLLEDIQQYLKKENKKIILLRLSSDKPYLDLKQWEFIQTSIKDQHFILLDSAGCLNFWQFHRFLTLSKKAPGIIVTTHHRTRLPTLRYCKTSPETLVKIVSQLLHAKLTPDIQLLNTLYQKHQGNIRECLRELYDVYSETTS
jgi:nucleoside-triphosphatase THEP1